METSYLLSFDLFQHIVYWLSISTHAYRKGRHYLETNLALLQEESDCELERLIIAHAQDRVEIRQQMYNHLALLRDVRRRGNTHRAISEAYVNMFGGFTLQLPSWLEEVEQQLLFLTRLQRPERTNRRYEQLLRWALEKTYLDPDIAPEVIAELQNDLGRLLAQSSHHATQQARRHAFEEAIHCHKAALNIFTIARYPLQYAKTCMYLGYAYQRHGTSVESNLQEHAISCYQDALRVYAQNYSPEQWANIQTALGRAYAQRMAGPAEENLNLAIAYHQAALQAINKETFPRSWATIQINLGDAYMHQRNKNHGYYRELAMASYKAALSVYSSPAFPREWADIHIRLAAIFRSYAEVYQTKRDLYVRCAIVCSEEALQFYSSISSPVEYAATLVNLGHLHLMRTEGDQFVNLDQASRCYRNALHVFTSQAFPAECSMILNNLSDAESRREALNNSTDPLTPIPTRV